MAESAVLMSSHWASGLMSTCLVVLLFASLQIFKAAFTQTRAMTVLGALHAMCFSMKYLKCKRSAEAMHMCNGLRLNCTYFIKGVKLFGIQKGSIDLSKEKL